MVLLFFQLLVHCYFQGKHTNQSKVCRSSCFDFVDDPQMSRKDINRGECWGSKSWPNKKHTQKVPEISLQFGNAFLFLRWKKMAGQKASSGTWHESWLHWGIAGYCLGFFDKELHSEPCKSICCRVYGTLFSLLQEFCEPNLLSTCHQPP